MYNKLKFVALVVLPMLATLYFIFSLLVDLPNARIVLGLMTIVYTIVSVSLWVISSLSGSYDGRLVVFENDEGKRVYSLELHTPVDDLDTKREVRFKVGGSPSTDEDS